MKRIIMMVAAALLLCGAFASCTKDNLPNQITVGNATTDIVFITYDFASSGNDGITFNLSKDMDCDLGFIQFATKNEGKTLDLTKLDPIQYESTEDLKYYCYCVNIDVPAEVDLWGDERKPTFAESGTLRYTLEKNILTLDLDAVVNGETVRVHFKGKTSERVY